MGFSLMPIYIQNGVDLTNSRQKLYVIQTNYTVV